VLEAARARDELRIAAAVDQPDAAGLGAQVADGVVATSDLAAGLGACDVYIDFTAPASTREAAQAAARLRRAAVIGTTGLAAADEAAIAELARVAPVVFAANFSLGVNLVLGLVRQAARALGPEWDAEVVETHHRAKRDAPSGTALRLAEALAEATGRDLGATARYQRHGDIGPRTDAEIGIQTLRGGDVVGDHTIYFLGQGERVEITHRATSRDTFAHGAVRAALWVSGRPPGLYDMRDVLGFATS
jgi:4-hydroxy-tetrahydrodipicolinate reductase